MAAAKRYVLFGPAEPASQWRDEHPNVPADAVIHVWGDPHRLQGVSSRDTEVVRLKGAWASPHFDLIDLKLRALEVGRR